MRKTTMRAAFENAQVAPGGGAAPLVKKLLRCMEKADKTASRRRAARKK